MNQIPIENCSFNGNTICFYRAKMSLKLQFFPFPILTRQNYGMVSKNG